MFLIIVISSFILSTLNAKTLTIQHNGINSGSILRSITRKDFRDVAFPHYLISGLHKLAGAGRRAVDSSENGRILIYFVFLVLKRRHPDIR